MPSASSLENMSGILIALLILLIAAFRDAQKVQRAPLRFPVSDDDCLSQSIAGNQKALSLESQFFIVPDTTTSNKKDQLVIYRSLFLSWLLSVHILFQNKWKKRLSSLHV